MHQTWACSLMSEAVSTLTGLPPLGFAFHCPELLGVLRLVIAQVLQDKEVGSKKLLLVSRIDAHIGHSTIQSLARFP